MRESTSTSPRSTTGRWVRAARATTLATCLALTAAVAAPPAQAGDTYDYQRTFTTPAADVVKGYEILQDRSPDANGRCALVASSTWEVNGATSAQNETDLETAIAQAVHHSNQYLTDRITGITVVGTGRAQTYASGTHCSDVSDNDYHRRLSTLSSAARYFAAVATGIAVDAITAAVLITGASYVAPAFATTRTFAFLTGCLAGAMGTFASYAVLGVGGYKLGAALVACITEGSTGVALKKVAAWVSQRGFAAQLAAVRDEGAELIPDAVANAMQTELARLGGA